AKAQAALDNATKDVPLKEAALATAQAALNTGVDTSALQEAKKKTAAALTKAQGERDSAKSTRDTAQTTKTAKETAKDNAYKAWQAAQSASSYPYVYETSAGSGVKVSKSWEANGTYVSNAVVMKKKASNVPGATNTGMRYLYFVAISIKSNSSTATKDLLGTLTLKKSGSNSFSNVKLNVGIEMGYSPISSTLGDGVIPTKPAALSDGDGFDADSEYTFTFEADDTSTFTVNTVGQGRIVAGMNIDYDQEIGDRYSSSDLEFWNGNYASFNKNGTLTLYCDEMYKYLYSIDKNDKLTQLNVKRDSYEEAFILTTRTLGRYVVSNTRLRNTGSSGGSSSRPDSSSSGSGAGGGTVIVTPVPTTPKPSVPAKPASSPAPKPSSSPAPKPSSSAPPSSSEPESLPELSSSLPEESSRPDEIVDVGGEGQEPPETEKRGVPTVVWALLVALIVAIPVTFGVSYYLKNQNGRKRH
ncbi:MAG: hypothetical protein RRY21_04195, partial [Oscillospiraceae bacterium]